MTQARIRLRWKSAGSQTHPGVISRVFGPAAAHIHDLHLHLQTVSCVLWLWLFLEKNKIKYTHTHTHTDCDRGLVTANGATWGISCSHSLMFPLCFCGECTHHTGRSFTHHTPRLQWQKKCTTHTLFGYQVYLVIFYHWLLEVLSSSSSSYSSSPSSSLPGPNQSKWRRLSYTVVVPWVVSIISWENVSNDVYLFLFFTGQL